MSNNEYVDPATMYLRSNYDKPQYKDKLSAVGDSLRTSRNCLLSVQEIFERMMKNKANLIENKLVFQIDIPSALLEIDQALILAAELSRSLNKESGAE